MNTLKERLSESGSLTTICKILSCLCVEATKTCKKPSWTEYDEPCSYPFIHGKCLCRLPAVSQLAFNDSWLKMNF